ncbi:hypothetical protein AC249_AIPGENE22056 [Exaiptasia diaphana]|nr:hypothetical protein AC249_AIPGENE22056 [Exaiptasia diaphana]
MVLKHMAERRRKVKNANIYHSGYTTTESETSSCDSPPSTLSSSPELDSKRKLWKDYFNQDLTQASCDTIILVPLNKDHIRDIQMMKHLMPRILPWSVIQLKRLARSSEQAELSPIIR